MKVLFVVTESSMDHCFTMCHGLSDRVDLRVVITAKKMTPEIREFCRSTGAAFFRRASFKNPLALLQDLRLLLKLRSAKADLVWFSGLSFYQSLFLKLLSGNFLINVHDVELHPQEKDRHGILTQKIIYRFHKKSVAVMSRSQAEIFKQKFNLQPYLLQLPLIDYYNSVAPVKPPPVKEDGGIKFFFFGTIMPYKGIETLLEASEILTSKSLVYRLNIYGRVKYHIPDLLQKISQDKNITLFDRYADYTEVSGIFASNDVIIIPYKQVSQCGPLLIAFQCGVPAILSSLPGFVEYADDNQSGLIFSNGPRGLAEKMEFFINNSGAIKEMSAYIKSDAGKKYSMSNLANSYVELFEKRLGKET